MQAARPDTFLDIGDTSNLECLDNEQLLNWLRNRYRKKIVYGYVGDSLVAVNPCEELPIYSKQQHERYTNLRVRSGEAPHVFWVADHVYHSLLDIQNQCVIVSGDSGSGKTKNTKFILQHLVHVVQSNSDLVDRLTQANSLLELFGNAATVLNQNSSRFGKLIELEYDPSGSLHSARLECFILEKFRVTCRHPHEKNFHAFYCLFAGMSPDQKDELELEEDASKYRILQPASGVEDVYRDQSEFEYYKQQFNYLEVMLHDVGFSSEEIRQLYNVMSSVLHVANVSFDIDEDGEKATIADEQSADEVAKENYSSSFPLGASSGRTRDRSERKMPVLTSLLRNKPGRSILNACHVLGLENWEELTDALVSVQTFAGGEIMLKNKTVRQAKDGRDALARELYAALFYGITDKINSKLQSVMAMGKKRFTRKQNNSCIRLLDIFGFENLQHNGFEQLLINATNEKLHQYYLQYTILRERQDYAAEGVDIHDVTFKDNSAVLSLIFDKPSGIIPLVGEEVSVPKSSDKSFLSKITAYNSNKSTFKTYTHKTYRQTHRELIFGIMHYAGEVVYNAENFLEKNSSTLPNSLRNVIQDSNNVFVYDYFLLGNQSMMSQRPGRGSFRGSMRSSGVTPVLPGRSTGKLTGKATDHFQNSLRHMMSKLQTAKPVFVRCIKPNMELTPAHFDSDLVNQQLLSSGLLEVATIRKYGYPVRIEFKEFTRRYSTIIDESSMEVQEQCEKILQEAGISDYRFGKTKVFLKTQHRDDLESVKSRKMNERQAAEKARKEAEQKERERDERIRARKETVEVEDSLSGIYSESSSSETYINGQRSSESGIGTVNNSSEDLAKMMKDGHEEEEEEEEKPRKGDSLVNFAKQPAFNAAGITEREFENDNETEMKFRRISRFIMYILVFVLVIASGSASRISLIWLAKGINQAKADDISNTATMLMACQVIPTGVSWISSILRSMFGRKEWPTFKGLFLICFIDTLQTVARSILVFRILPFIHPLQGIVLSLAVCQIPAIMQLLWTTTQGGRLNDGRTRNRVKENIHTLLLVTSLLIQFGALALFLNVDQLFPVEQSETATITERIEHLKDKWWTLPMLVVFVTMGWWENFAYGKVTIFGWDIKLKTWRRAFLRVREASFVYSGFIQVFVSVLMVHLWVDDLHVSEQITKYMSSVLDIPANIHTFPAHARKYGLVYIQTASTFMCVFWSGLACRLYMQRLAFSLPILLVPITSGIVVILCYPKDLLQYVDIPDICKTQFSMQDKYTWLTIVIGIALWVSYVIISKHIWHPQCERMAKMSRLFTYNHRDPVFPDISLVLGRRNDEVQKLERHGHLKKDKTEDEEQPTVYICPTLWHESRQEMVQLLKSLFRLDFELCAKRIAKKKLDTDIQDIYDAEIHMMFDDAFETNPDSQQRVVNGFVELLLEVMPGAVSSIAKGRLDLKAPDKFITPYGGRLEWEMPGGTKLNVHLKDKEKIRHKKRWSQIMYMYYLLGFKLFRGYDTVDDLLNGRVKTESGGTIKVRKKSKQRVRPFTSMLNNLPRDVIQKAENTFIMCLDGDVDFRPEAVQLLIDRMKKNKKVAAVCGRIHPIGDGPMVWYQQFEYAVGHWLQKAAEHVFGCVLCCPGCFSMFRGSALIDDNVMRMYATEPTEARHYVQYEQGEDRWLCTLLLQQGYKIDYCAGADSYTYAPETFNDFYIQRRRWSPSTLANVVDLIGSWRTTIKMNDNISLLFMMYQFLLLACSVLAPGLVVYMIAGSYNEVLGIHMWEAYLLSVIPVLLYIILCLKAKTQTQVTVAAVMSAVYAIVMVIVVVGQILKTVQDGSVTTPSVMFMIAMAVVFVTAGLIHPKEILCLPHGILYYLTVPSTFVFLTVFFLCNLNVVTWGTRETPQNANSTDIDNVVPVVRKGRLGRWLESLGLKSMLDDLKTFVTQLLGSRKASDTPNLGLTPGTTTPCHSVIVEECRRPLRPTKQKVIIAKEPKYWAKHLPNQNPNMDDIRHIDEDERKFWSFIIEEYLKPLKPNKEKQEKIKADLISARNNIVFAYFLINLLFTLLVLEFQMKEDKLRDMFFISGKYEPLSAVFLAFFTLLVAVQFFGMIAHQWGTFLHLIASTKLNLCAKDDNDQTSMDAIREAKKLQSVVVDDVDMLPPDYDSDDEDEDDGTLPRISEAMMTTIKEVDYSSDDSDHVQARPQYEEMFHQRYRTVRHKLDRLQSRQRRPSISRSREQAEYQRRFNVYNRRRSSIKPAISGGFQLSSFSQRSDIEITPDYDIV